MNATFRSAQRAKALSPLGHWIVFSFGKQIEMTKRNGRISRTVEWRGLQYIDVKEMTADEATRPAVKQSRFVSSGLKMVRVDQ